MSLHYSFPNTGTCSSKVEFDIEDGHIHSVRFQGGCSGNLQGIAQLVEGMGVDEAVSRLSGIRCGTNPTSCPDQLAKALKLAIAGTARGSGLALGAGTAGGAGTARESSSLN